MFQGTVQIQKQQELVEKTHEEKLNDMKGDLLQCQQEGSKTLCGVRRMFPADQKYLSPEHLPLSLTKFCSFVSSSRQKQVDTMHDICCPSLSCKATSH